MTDIEMTALCAKAIGLSVGLSERVGKYSTGIMVYDKEEYVLYDPIHDDAQAMALVKKFCLSINPQDDGSCEAVYFAYDDEIRIETNSVNRAIVECVAKLQQSCAK